MSWGAFLAGSPIPVGLQNNREFVVSETQTLSTTCPMDCPDTCALEVTVKDGVIERIGAGDGHPNTNGFICSKVAQFSKRVYHESRILHPMKRRGPKGEGDFAPMSWDEALGEIADRFHSIREQWGGEALLPYHYGGSNGSFSDGFLDDLFFARCGASRLAKTLCAVPTTEVSRGMYGRMPGVAFEDFPRARFILVWGGNPRASNIHLVPYLKDAKKRGASIAVVDPVRTLSSDLADLHLPVLPGTDLPVALSMIRLWKEGGKLADEFLREHADGLEPLLEQADGWSAEKAAAVAGITPEAIRKLARCYAESSPAVLRCGWGLERNRNGGQAVGAILAMPALLGKFGARGGGYALSSSGAGSLDLSKLWQVPSWQSRIINMTELGRVLTSGVTPPIQGLFVYNCNPAVTVPDQNVVLEGLKRNDLFTVVHDQLLTDTARYADILLPATTFLEHHDIRKAYGSYVVGGVRPVIPRQGESRTNFEVFAALGRVMGFEDEAFGWDTDEAVERLIGALELNGKPADRDALIDGKTQLFDFPGPCPVQFESVFPRTSDRKVHLTPDVLGKRPYRYKPLDSGNYPLALISPSSTKSTNSTFGEWSFKRLELTIHPRDAKARDIHDGDSLRAFNALGELFCQARVSDAVRQGVVMMPKGAWMKVSRNGRTSTALCPADVSEVGGAACYNDARVEVERAE